METSSQKTISKWCKLWRFTYKSLLLLWLLSIVWVVALKFVPVYFTPLMIKRSFSQMVHGESIRNEKQWVPIEEISPNLTIACVASEDNLFMKHNGFSISAITKAIEDKKKGKKLRGGSTISQQTAKNVFTFGTRTWVRKGQILNLMPKMARIEFLY